MNPLFLVLTIIILLIVCLFLGLTAFIAKTIVGGNRQTLDEAWNWQMLHAPGCREFQKSDFTSYTVPDSAGYLYHVSYLPAKETDSDRYVVVAHGYTDTRWGALKYIQFYHALGFHCICFDERGHGENSWVPCSYGVREVEGLLAVLDDTVKRYGANIRVGIHGESLGGATVLTSLKYPLEKYNVKFAVDDCGFNNILPILKAGLKNTHIPAFMVYPASLFAKIRYGVSFTEARPLESVRENTLPLLIMHGAEDDFILPNHSTEVKNTTKGYAELHFFEGAGHAESAIKDPGRYLAILKEFLIQIKYH